MNKYESSVKTVYAPVERVCGLNIVSPFSPVLEDLNFPHPEDIAKAVKRVLNK